MAAARDQAARIVRTEPETAGGRSCAAMLPTSCGPQVAEEPRRRPAETPGARNRAAGCAVGRRRTSAAPKSGQAQIRHDGRARPAGARSHRLRRLLTFWSGASMSRPTTPMSAPTTPRSARGCRAMSRRSCPRDNSIVRTGDVIFRIDDGDYRIAVESGAQQDRDPAGDHRPHRPSGHGAGKRGRAGQGAACFRGSGAEARRPRLRSPAGAEHQGICLARHLRSVRSRPRPGHGGSEIGAGRL